MPVSDRRLIYSLLCLTPGNITITVVMICQCHLLYFSSFLAKRPLSLTPTSFCFPSAFPNTLCQKAEPGIWEPEEFGPETTQTFPTTLLSGALRPRANHCRDDGGTGENKGIFYFVEADGNFSGIKWELQQIPLFFVFSLGFFPLHTPQRMGRCTQFFHCQALFLQLQVITKVSPTTSVEERGQQASVTKPLV